MDVRRAAIAATSLAFALAAPSTAAGACGSASALRAPSLHLRVSGTQMVDTRGRVVRPYGISLVGGPQTRNWARTEKSTAAQIIAATRWWRANAIRIQVSEAQLLDHPTPGSSYNRPFAAMVDRLVCLVLAQRALPIVNDTTLFTAKERGPTARTIRFWQFMSRRYGNRLPVVFDLFNEPRLTHPPGSTTWFSPDTVWHLWQFGGQVGGVDYVGMQALVDEIRLRQHADNVIWAEEPYTYLMARRSHMDLLPTHLLRGANVVYAFHKAQMDRGSPWLKALRDLTHRGIPLVDSEWAQYAATDRPWECYDNSYERVPHFLVFLRRLRIGLIAWSLQPGSLVKGRPGHDTVHDGNDTRYTTNPEDLIEPSVLKRGYGCNADSLGQGAGALVKGYFRRYSRRLSARLFPSFG